MSRGNLFAKVAHAERMAEAFEVPPRPRPAPVPPTPQSTPALPQPAALATAAARVRRPRPKVTIAIPPRQPRPGHAAPLSAKSLKATLVLAPDQVAALPPPQAKTVPVVIAVGGRQIRASFNAKSLRKSIATIVTHGADNVVAVVQGRLEAGDVLAEAGMAVTVKKAAQAGQSGTEEKT